MILIACFALEYDPHLCYLFPAWASQSNKIWSLKLDFHQDIIKIISCRENLSNPHQEVAKPPKRSRYHPDNFDNGYLDSHYPVHCADKNKRANFIEGLFANKHACSFMASLSLTKKYIGKERMKRGNTLSNEGFQKNKIRKFSLGQFRDLPCP